MTPRTEAIATDRRSKTREALVNAARDLVFERSAHEKISISDITLAAGVATGTFYNYFDTKQRVFEAVLEGYRTQFAEELAITRARLSDPAMIVAVTLKYYFQQSQHNVEWNEFVRFSGLPGPHVLRQSDEDCLADIRRGMKAGRFRVEDVFFAQSLVTGMIDHINTEVSTGKLPLKATDDAVRYILRMLGLPDLVAKALTQSPLPPVSAARHLDLPWQDAARPNG
jgi:AcrR family transcriptional regulator